MLCISLINSLKCSEEIWDIFFLDSHTGILNRIDHVDISVVLLLALNIQAYVAFLCILYGIIQDIHKYLLYPDLITPKLCRKIRCNIYPKLKILLLRLNPKHTNEIGKHISGIIILNEKIHISRLEL